MSDAIRKDISLMKCVENKHSTFDGTRKNERLLPEVHLPSAINLFLFNSKVIAAENRFKHVTYKNVISMCRLVDEACGSLNK